MTPLLTPPVVTAEVRWFLPGPPPAALAAWFGADPGDAPERVDRYLRLPGAAAVGVKLREGRLEVKARVGEQHRLTVAPAVVGLADRWVKRALPGLPGETRPADAWIEVVKRRQTRVFAVEGGRVLEAGDERPARGATLEFAVLGIAGRPWWSLAVEAFGEDGPEAARDATAARLADAPAALPLDASLAYPAWLDRAAA